jgi:ABC-type hemin transport system ATPase subunit
MLQQLTLRRFPQSEQIDLYLQAMYRTHPPNLGLATALAKNGASIVPLLMHRLARANSDSDKVLLLAGFQSMQRDAYYSVSAEATLMAFLELQVSTMKDPVWKDMANKHIEAIRKAGAR